MLDFHIIITTYNRTESCLSLIKSIQKQLQSKSYSLHVFDDHSNESLNIPEDDSIKYFRFERNMGKREYWFVVDYAFKQIPEAKYYIVLPDDVKLEKNFFKNAVTQWESINDTHKATLELMINKEREGKHSLWTPYNARKEKHGEYDFWHNQWSDLCFIAQRELFESMLNKTISPVPYNRWDSNHLLSSGVGEQISQRLHGAGYNMYSVVSSLCVHLDIPSLMNPEARKIIPMKSIVKNYEQQQEVYVCIASIPSRLALLIETINSLLPQVDKVYLYLNNYSANNADGIKNIDPEKIDYIIGDNTSGDAGKFYWGDKINGFICTCDDDIIYPPDYIETIVSGIEKYKRKSIVTFHGRIFARIPVKSYYKWNKLFNCQNKIDSDSVVNVGGTGVMGWHSSTIKISMQDFPSANMADVHLSILANRNKVPIMVLAHEGAWIKVSMTINSIYSQMVNSDSEHVRRINAEQWNVYEKESLHELAYVINLQHRDDRFDNMLYQYDKHGLKLSRVNAIYGRIEFSNQPVSMQGFLGCYESHLRLLGFLMDKPDDYFIILEDDCEFVDGFQEKLAECMMELPEDWDLLYLGGSLVRQNSVEDYSENLKRAKDVLCTHAYIVNKKSIAGLIEYIQKKAYKIDVIYCEYQKNHNCFMAYPALIRQVSQYSDVVIGKHIITV